MTANIPMVGRHYLLERWSGKKGKGAGVPDAKREA